MAIIPVSKTPTPACTIALPEVFTIYNRELVDFERVLSVFNWQLTDTDVTIDLTPCRMGNFQALRVAATITSHSGSDIDH